MMNDENCEDSSSFCVFLTTERLEFSHWKHEEIDFPLALKLWGNLDVTKFIGGPFTHDQIKERLTREIENQTEYGVQYWPIYIKGEIKCEEKFIGCCGLRPYRRKESVADNEKIFEIGFHLLPEYWGQGYAKEAANAVISYAFEVLKVTALFAGHNPQNNGSKTVLEKLGFQFSHTEFYPPTGLDHPSYFLYHR